MSALTAVAPLLMWKEADYSEDLINSVAGNVLKEIHSIMGVLGKLVNAIDFSILEQRTACPPARIERLILEGKIHPRAKVRLSVD